MPLASAALAQSGPAELPPSSFAGNQYVDSTGCVFLRAEVNGAVRWVPRLTADRAAVCGYPPSFAPAPQAASVDAAAVPPAVRAKPAAVGVRKKKIVRIARHARAAAQPADLSGVPKGYKVAWTDGRLNRDRGPRTAQGDAQMALVFDTRKVPMVEIPHPRIVLPGN